MTPAVSFLSRPCSLIIAYLFLHASSQNAGDCEIAYFEQSRDRNADEQAQIASHQTEQVEGRHLPYLLDGGQFELLPLKIGENGDRSLARRAIVSLGIAFVDRVRFGFVSEASPRHRASARAFFIDNYPQVLDHRVISLREVEAITGMRGNVP